MTRSLQLALGTTVLFCGALTAAAGEPGAGSKEGPERSAVIGGTAPTVTMGVAERTSVDFKGESLKDVLDFLSTRSGMNVRSLDDKTLELKVTFKLDNVTWRDILGFMAEKYKLIVDFSRENAGIIIVKSPPRVTIDFPQATDVRVIIATIADQTDANLIIGPELKDQKVSLSLKDVPWEEALDMVVRTVNFVAVKDKFNTYRITTQDRLEQQLETRIFRLSYIQPEGPRYEATIDTEFAEKKKATGAAGTGKEAISLLGVLKDMLSKNAKVSYERSSNTLVVTDTPTKLDSIQKLIESVDVPPKQVHLAVRMVELSDTESELLGVEWTNGFTASVSGMSFDTTFPFMTKGAPAGVADGAWWGKTVVGNPLLGKLNLNDLVSTLHFVKTKTSGSVVQSPSIIALDNQEATIHVGKNIRFAEYFSESTDGGGISSGYREAKTSPIKEGIQVLVIPQVTGPDGNVLLTVIPKSESLDTGAGEGGFITFGGGETQLKLPQTIQRIVVTKMLLRDTETGVIAGLKKTVSSTSESRVPVLSDIPVLGWMFKSRKKPAESNLRENLMIFVTPTVIDLQKEMRITRQATQIRREIAGPFFTYDEKLPEEQAAPATPR